MKTPKMHNTVTKNVFSRLNSKLGTAKERIHILKDSCTEVTQDRMQTATKEPTDE